MDSYIQMNFDPTNRQKLFGNNWNNFSHTTFDDIRRVFTIDEEKEIKFSLKEKLENPVINSSFNENEEEENERFESVISFPNFLLVINEVLDDYQNFL